MFASLMTLIVYLGTFLGIAWVLGWVSRPRPSEPEAERPSLPPSVRLDRPEARPAKPFREAPEEETRLASALAT